MAVKTTFRWYKPQVLVEVTAKAEQRLGQDILRLTRSKAPIRTGRLMRSYRLKGPQRVGSRVIMEVGSDLYYAPYVEYGTSRMHARPHLGPAVEQAIARLRTGSR